MLVKCTRPIALAAAKKAMLDSANAQRPIAEKFHRIQRPTGMAITHSAVFLFCLLLPVLLYGSQRATMTWCM
jgi:hypothetical protein